MKHNQATFGILVYERSTLMGKEPPPTVTYDPYFPSPKTEALVQTYTDPYFKKDDSMRPATGDGKRK